MKTNILSGIARSMIAGILCHTHLAQPLAAQHTSRLTMEQSTDLQTWQSVPVTPGMIDANGKLLVPSATPQRLYRMQVEMLTLASITTQPIATSITGGQTTTLTVAASGTAPFTYQWYEGSVGMTTTPVGTNSASFTTPALTDTTSYWVRVSNAAGPVDSAAATVTVTCGNVPVPDAAEFALIPAGNFQMGDNFAEEQPEERPVHTVNVSAFYMGKYEVTKELWDSVRTYGVANGYTDLPTGDGKGATHPVHTISWYNAVQWCNARSQRDGLTPCYMFAREIYKVGTADQVWCNWNASGYRLPTEAEWEKAARGGLSGRRFPWGDTISHSQANYFATSSYSYDVSGSVNIYHPSYTAGGFPVSSPVGSFPPNGYGLYDMAGNMWEWVWDWYEGDYYDSSPSADPRGPSWSSWSSYRVLRGGSWKSSAFICRVTRRGAGDPADKKNGFGFRVARCSVPQ